MTEQPSPPATDAWRRTDDAEAIDDPLTDVVCLYMEGVKDAERFTALLARAARYVDRAQQSPSEDSVAQASIAVAQAKALSTQASLLASSKLFELGGTSAAQRQHGLDRYWRNARTHTLHDPVRWKYHLLGNWVLNSKRPARHDWN